MSVRHLCSSMIRIWRSQTLQVVQDCFFFNLPQLIYERDLSARSHSYLLTIFWMTNSSPVQCLSGICRQIPGKKKQHNFTWTTLFCQVINFALLLLTTSDNCQDSSGHPRNAQPNHIQVTTENCEIFLASLLALLLCIRIFTY